MGIRTRSWNGAASPPDWRVFMRECAAELGRELVCKTPAPARQTDRRRLARAFVLAKHGRTEEARQQIDAVASRLAVPARGRPAREQDLGLRADFVLVDAHVRVYEDRHSTPCDVERLRWVLDALPADDSIGQALALNQLCIHALHMGHFDKAQEHAESAIRLYRKGGAEFGSLHLHAHLGQIKLIRGDLIGAVAQYAEMEERLAVLPEDTVGLLAISRALRSEVAYEMNDLSGSAALLADAMGSVEEDDAWLDVRAAAYRVRTRLAFAQSGLPGALTELAHCERMAEHWNMPRLARLMQIERLRALTLSGETDAAAAVMRAVGLSPAHYDHDDGNDWALRQGSTAVAIARLLVRSRRSREALGFIEPAEDFAIRGGQLLALAKLRVIRGTAHWCLGQKTDAARALLSALRLLGQQPFRRFMLDEGRHVLEIVRATLDGEHVRISPGPEHRRRLSELSHAFTVASAGAAAPVPGIGKGNAAAGGLQRKYLELLALGLSNKEIGRTMGVSVNTVKYHLKGIFRELRAESRTQALAEAYRLQIIATPEVEV